MDSKWGGVIVAALAGVGLLLIRNGSYRVGHSNPPMREFQAKSKRSRPSKDDFMELQMLRMEEYLRWALENGKLDRYQKSRVNTAHGKDLLTKANTKRKKWLKEWKEEKDFDGKLLNQGKHDIDSNAYPLYYSTTEDYITLQNLMTPKRKNKDEIGSGGPFNYIFDTSASLKNSTAKAMSLAKTYLETHTFDNDAQAHDYFLSIYQDEDVINRHIAEGGLGGFTLDDIGLALWNEQSSYKSRNLLKNKTRKWGKTSPEGFDIETCQNWIKYFYVNQTYKGYKREKEAIDKMNGDYHDKNFWPIYRFVGNWEKIPTSWKQPMPVGLNFPSEWWNIPDRLISFPQVEVVFAPETLDITSRVDLLVRIPQSQGNLADDGKIILAGVQIKPLSFFRNQNRVSGQNERHEIVSGDILLQTHKTHAKSHEEKRKVKTFSQKPRQAAEFFNVQTLVYDEEEKWLNYDAVMMRIQYNLKDPLLVDFPFDIYHTEDEDEDYDLNEGLKEWFENQEANPDDTEIDKKTGLNYHPIPYSNYPTKYLATYPILKTTRGYCRKCELERHEQKKAYGKYCGRGRKGWVCVKHPPMDTPLEIKRPPTHHKPKKTHYFQRPHHIKKGRWANMTKEERLRHGWKTRIGE